MAPKKNDVDSVSYENNEGSKEGSVDLTKGGSPLPHENVDSVPTSNHSDGEETPPGLPGGQSSPRGVKGDDGLALEEDEKIKEAAAQEKLPGTPDPTLAGTAPTAPRTGPTFGRPARAPGAPRAITPQVSYRGQRQRERPTPRILQLMTPRIPERSPTRTPDAKVTLCTPRCVPKPADPARLGGLATPDLDTPDQLRRPPAQLLPVPSPDVPSPEITSPRSVPSPSPRRRPIGRPRRERKSVYSSLNEKSVCKTYQEKAEKAESEKAKRAESALADSVREERRKANEMEDDEDISDDGDPSSLASALEEEPDKKYEVEEILKDRFVGKGREKEQQFLCKWVGYDAKSDLTWEPLENLKHLDRYLEYISKKDKSTRVSTPVTKLGRTTRDSATKSRSANKKRGRPKKSPQLTRPVKRRRSNRLTLSSTAPRDRQGAEALQSGPKATRPRRRKRKRSESSSSEQLESSEEDLSDSEKSSPPRSSSPIRKRLRVWESLDKALQQVGDNDELAWNELLGKCAVRGGFGIAALRKRIQQQNNKLMHLIGPE